MNYEIHITVEPKPGHLKEFFNLAAECGLKLANVLKYSTSNVVTADESVMTGNEPFLTLAEDRVIKVVKKFQESGFTVTRYKIEEQTIDSKYEDSLGLLVSKDAS